MMKYLLLITMAFMLSCGDLPDGCGDGILSKSEVCEMNTTMYCSELFAGVSTGVMYCNDCHSWDIEECQLTKEEH